MSRGVDFGKKEEVVLITSIAGGIKLVGQTKGDGTKRGRPRNRFQWKGKGWAKQRDITKGSGKRKG